MQGFLLDLLQVVIDTALCFDGHMYWLLIDLGRVPGMLWFDVFQLLIDQTRNSWLL